MADYAIYARIGEGQIKRIKELSTSYSRDLLYRHFYKELLIGFPEKMVFWANPEGPSMGIAPRHTDSQAPYDEADQK